MNEGGGVAFKKHFREHFRVCFIMWLREEAGFYFSSVLSSIPKSFNRRSKSNFPMFTIICTCQRKRSTSGECPHPAQLRCCLSMLLSQIRQFGHELGIGEETVVLQEFVMSQVVIFSLSPPPPPPKMAGSQVVLSLGFLRRFIRNNLSRIVIDFLASKK